MKKIFKRNWIESFYLFKPIRFIGAILRIFTSHRLLIGLLGVFVLSSPSRTSYAQSKGKFTLNHPQVKDMDRKSVCLSFQGNGTYFVSHIGALIALLERNFEPVFSVGGSSGAIVAALSRAIVENKSFQRNGEFMPQRAAKVLAASSQIIESILFLPRITTPFSLLHSIDAFKNGVDAGVLASEVSDGLVNAESIVGQATLVVEFYRTIDFSGPLAEKSITARENLVGQMWKKYVNALEVSSRVLASALLSSRSSLVKAKRLDLISIQDRFFKMFRSSYNSPLNSYKEKQEEWNKFIEQNEKVLGLDSEPVRQRIFQQFLDFSKSVSSFDAVFASLSGKFFLADPDILFRAYGGTSVQGKLIGIPSNVIIHSTARRASKNGKSFKERLGLDHLYQIYFTNINLRDGAFDVLSQPSNHPMRPFDPKFKSVIPSSRVLVTSSGLANALSISTGEPTAFQRIEVSLDQKTLEKLRWKNDGDTLVGFGGWLEKNSIGTAAKFAICKNSQVDFLSPVNDGLGIEGFSKMAFLGLLFDGPISPNDQLDIKTAKNQNYEAFRLANKNNSELASVELDKIETAIRSMNQIFKESNLLRGRMGRLPVIFSHENPSEYVGNGKESVNITFRSNRRAMMLGSYQYTSRMLERTLGGRGGLDLWLIPGVNLDILTRSTPEAVMSIVNSALPPREP
jgi:hypothetical protein